MFLLLRLLLAVIFPNSIFFPRASLRLSFILFELGRFASFSPGAPLHTISHATHFLDALVDFVGAEFVSF